MSRARWQARCPHRPARTAQKERLQVTRVKARAGGGPRDQPTESELCAYVPTREGCVCSICSRCVQLLLEHLDTFMPLLLGIPTSLLSPLADHSPQVHATAHNGQRPYRNARRSRYTYAPASTHTRPRSHELRTTSPTPSHLAAFSSRLRGPIIIPTVQPLFPPDPPLGCTATPLKRI